MTPRIVNATEVLVRDSRPAVKEPINQINPATTTTNSGRYFVSR